ncbi:MAG: hypothetical protein KDB80_00860, partial [Planctomycetes bacterium]|nr:hypothetical protein [Planctomycetota bacterium]
IAFGETIPAVDGNVERVASRHAGIREDVKRSPTRRRIRAWAIERIAPGRAGDFNQALMELGATICTPRQPACKACPIAADCLALAERLTHVLPVLPAKRPTVPVTARMALVHHDDTRVVAMRLPADGPNAGQLELPGAGVLVDCPTPGDLEAALLETTGLRTDVGPELATARHSITHHRITLVLHEVRARRRLPKALVVADPADPDLPWSTASRKVLRKIGRC